MSHQLSDPTNMRPVIQQLSAKKLVGMRIRTSRIKFQPYLLWSKFMPEKKYVKHTVNNSLYSMQVYDLETKVTPATEFDQWAAVEVSAYDEIPEGMQSYDITGGLYATFIHKGKASGFPKTMHYIHNVWLPGSGYDIDSREHFELLGEKYKNDSEESEEEVWVPIKPQKK